MNRRRFVALIAGSLAAALASAQQPGKMRRVGYLRSTGTGLPPADSLQMKALRQGLRDAGYVEGKNLAFEWRSADGKVEPLRRLVEELVAARLDALMIETTPGVRAALEATRAIPIVFVYVSDPVGSGYAASLARPGRNATGVTNILPELSGKLLELLQEVRPGVKRTL